MVEERPINVSKTLDTQNINIHVGRNENKIGGYQMVDMSDSKTMVDFSPNLYYYHYNIFQQKRYRLSPLLSNTL